jgi:aminoglycoside 3-N-acetyltransferase I
MSFHIQRLQSSDLPLFTSLIRLFEAVFEMKDFSLPSEAHLQQLLAKPDFFVFVAIQEGRVVGGLTSYLLHQYYATAPLVYIYDLAVATEYQYRGIGKELIASNNRYAKEIGAETVMVQADIADDYALTFYRATGATGQEVIHFEYPLKD